jgi:hypothetical protein
MITSRRLRFHLSTALVLMLVAALALGFCVRKYGREEWQISIENALEEKVSVESQKDSVKNVVLELFQSNGRANLILSPNLDPKCTVSLEIKNTSRREALNRICELSASAWEIRNGATVFYSLSTPPRLTERPSTGKDLQTKTKGALGRKISCCFLDTTLDEQIHFYGRLANLKVEVNPACKDNGADSSWILNEMHMDDAIIWSCYLSNTTWSFKKSPAGEDVLVITPLP